MIAIDPLSTQFFENGVRVAGAVTIQRSATDLYAVWKNLSELPRFIEDVEKIELSSPGMSRWTVTGPNEKSYSWDAAIINDEPRRVIAWKTDAEADVPNAGSVTFRELPFCRGTEVRAAIEYLPPAGKIGDTLAKASKYDPKSIVRRGLIRFRHLMEAGELATVAGQPAGDRGHRSGSAPGDEPRKTDAFVDDLAMKEKRS